MYQIGDNEGNLLEEKMTFTIVGVGKKPAKDWDAGSTNIRRCFYYSGD